jgi:hypothetical protein
MCNAYFSLQQELCHDTLIIQLTGRSQPSLCRHVAMRVSPLNICFRRTEWKGIVLVVREAY